MQLKQKKTQEEIIRELQGQVDELTATNHSLQDQLAHKEQFIAMIAHELRGPLSPIINYAQMIARQMHTSKEGPQRKAAVQRQTNIIIGQARRLTRLVNDLLDSTRLTAGQFTLIRETCDLTNMVRETVEQLQPVAPYHTLVVNVPADPIVGNWDCGRLQQALGNLLDNAIKYSDELTTVTVSVQRMQEIVRVSVHNMGVSIPAAEIGQLFRPYARLEGAGKRQGSGLGLYISRSIVEAHNGTLRLEPNTEEPSTEEPRGTTFSFDLPLNC
ncbi:MAG TPA: HAMP domain-containing sensor histidine kinase [Ktedonobacteraceae bacterium]|nr:HAMP domain-containing sensor histidine kinase [Ktedonobacteraceae bacterium]